MKGNRQFVTAARNVADVGLQEAEMGTVKRIDGIAIGHVQDHVTEPLYRAGNALPALDIAVSRVPGPVIRAYRKVDRQRIHRRLSEHRFQPEPVGIRQPDPVPATRFVDFLDLRRPVSPRKRLEIMHARHGSGSQLILAVSNLFGSVISLMVNFTAAGALVAVLSPLSFQTGVLIAGFGVLSYTLWSGFRASILTDFAQVVAMMTVAVIIIPWVLISLGGTDVLREGLALVTAEQANFFSSKAILEQGAPFFVAVLAYAIGNQTIAQRLFAVRQDLIKPTFITATIGYGSIVIGLGMLGLMALLIGMQPHDGDPNNLIPQMASTYLPPIVIALFFILVVGSLSSTADSDLSALSAIMMTDIYGKNIAKGKPNIGKMLLLGRATMIVATAIGLVLASFSLNILVMLVFVGALWGAIVFPVIASCYWSRVTNAAFVWAVVGGLLAFCIVRFELLSLDGVFGGFFEIVAGIGGGVVLGLMTFGFFGRMAGLVVGVMAGLVCTYYFMGFLHDYTVLLGSLTAYGASTAICIAISMASKQDFDFSLIGQRVTSFQGSDDDG